MPSGSPATVETLQEIYGRYGYHVYTEEERSTLSTRALLEMQAVFIATMQHLFLANRQTTFQGVFAGAVTEILADVVGETNDVTVGEVTGERSLEQVTASLEIAVVSLLEEGVSSDEMVNRVLDLLEVYAEVLNG